MAAQAINPSLQIQSWLLDTDYSCDEVEQIHGGNVNLTFKGTLSHPLKDGTRSIIVKQSREFIAVNTTMACPLHRCQVEELILRSLSEQQVGSFHGNVRVRTPRHYGTLLRHDSHLQIMEELPATRTLRDLLHCPGESLSGPQATAVGHALGKWLSEFHLSSCDRRDPVLAKALREHSWPTDVILPVIDIMVEKQIRDFPHLFKGMEDEIRARAKAAFMMVDGDGLGLTHGDTNISNILVSTDSSDIQLGIIDWEACHYGGQHHDLAILLAGLIPVERLCHTGVGAHVLEGVLHSYPVRSEASVFCTIAALGAWLFLWPLWCSPPPSSSKMQDMEELMEFAKNLMAKGLERDRRWIEGTVLAPLFEGVGQSEK